MQKIASKKTIVSRNGIFAFINPYVQICIIPLFRREWHCVKLQNMFVSQACHEAIRQSEIQ